MAQSIILTPSDFLAKQPDGTFAAYAENLQLQRDDAISAKEAADAKAVEVAAANAAALKAKDAEHASQLEAAAADKAAALAAKDAEKADALAAAKAASDAALAALQATANAAAATAAARIEALTASVAQLTADCQASIAAQPIGDLSDTLSPLEKLYFGLALEAENAAIAKANAEAAARNAAKKEGEPLEQLVAPLSPTAFFDLLVSDRIAALGTDTAKAALVPKAVAKLLTFPEQAQVAAFTTLGLGWAAAIPAEQRHAALIDATPAIIAKLAAMEPAQRDALIVQVMGA